MMVDMSVFVTIMASECSMVAMLYVCNEKSTRVCRRTFVPYNSGVSVEGCSQVLRSVGLNATRSIPTAITTDRVGSFISTHGTSPTNATIRNRVSVFVILLKPYLREKRKIITVNISDAAVGNAPIPAPLASIPKKTVPDTILHTSHVYGWGFTLPFKISHA